MDHRTSGLADLNRYPASSRVTIPSMDSEKHQPRASTRNAFFGLLVCGAAWGVLLGGELSLILSAEIDALRSNQRSMECFCICIAIMGTLGLVVGTLVDAKI